MSITPLASCLAACVRVCAVESNKWDAQWVVSDGNVLAIRVSAPLTPTNQPSTMPAYPTTRLAGCLRACVRAAPV